MFGIYIHNLDFHLIIHKNNKNCTIPYFINLISDRANFAVSGPTSSDHATFVSIYQNSEIAARNH